MLSANAELQPRSDGAAALGGDAYELSDPTYIEGDKRVMLEDSEPLICPDKARGVIARQPEDRLCQIVGAKTKELGGFGYFARQQCCPRQLDHRAHDIGHIDTLSLHDLFADAIDHRF